MSSGVSKCAGRPALFGKNPHYTRSTTAILTACLLGWSVLRWQRGLAAPADVVLVITLGFMVLHGTRDLAVALVEMVQDWAPLGEALQTLQVPHDMPERHDATTLERSRGKVRFADVDFSYGDYRPVLHVVNLTIAVGERVGLVGRSGSGKSTLLFLQQQQYNTSNGRIFIDGAGIALLNRNSLAAAISVVSQDVQLFHRSVMRNIRYGRADAPDADVVKAAKAAYADEFIAALPDGYHTPVGKRGLKLCGGRSRTGFPPCAISTGSS